MVGGGSLRQNGRRRIEARGGGDKGEKNGRTEKGEGRREKVDRLAAVRFRRGIFFAVAALATAACGSQQPAATRTVRDSAGVELVTMSVPDTMHRHWTIRTDAPLLKIGGSGDSGGVFGRSGAHSPIELSDGRIAVSVDDTVHVRVFDRQGRLVAGFMHDGEGPGEIPKNHGATLYMHGDSIFASDVAGGFDRTTIFDSRLALVRTVRVGVHDTSAGMPSSPLNLGVTSAGRVIYRFERTPADDRQFETIAEAPDTGGNAVSIARFRGYEYVKISNSGFIRSTFLMFGKAPAAALAGDRIYIGGNDGFMIDMLNPAGQLVRRLTIAMPTRRVTRAMRQQSIRDEFADTNAETGRLARMFAETEHFAKTLRFYDRFIGTREGDLWIDRARVGDNDDHHFWIFDSTAHFVAATSLPDALHLRAIWGDTVVVTGEDGDGSPFLELLGVEQHPPPKA